MASRRAQSISLPTQPTKQLEYIWEHPICIFGRKGIGKTTAGSVALNSLLPEGKKTLNFRFERGRQNLPILQVPPVKKEKGPSKLNWPDFLSYLDLFCDDDSYQLGVIDSIDKCYDECFTYVCDDKFGVTHPKEAGREAPSVWDSIRVEFESCLLAILDHKKSLVFLSHEKARTEELPDGTEYERWDLSCKPAAAKIIKDICEFVIYYGYTDTTDDGKRSAERVMVIRNKNNAVECACGRSDVFLQPDGKPLFRFKIPNDPEAVGDVIQAAYDNELYDYDYDERAERRKAERAKKKTAKRKRTPRNS